jgi:hypothetical protein
MNDFLSLNIDYSEHVVVSVGNDIFLWRINTKVDNLFIFLGLMKELHVWFFGLLIGR